MQNTTTQIDQKITNFLEAVSGSSDYSIIPALWDEYMNIDLSYITKEDLSSALMSEIKKTKLRFTPDIIESLYNFCDSLTATSSEDVATEEYIDMTYHGGDMNHE